MGEPPRGQYLRLTAARRVVNEAMRHARRVPLVAHARRCRVPAAAAARRSCADPPSWVAVFLRAYALAALDHPCLRRSYIAYPWPRIYVHAHSTAVVAVARAWEGQPAVLGAKVVAPERQSLADVTGHLRSFAERPVWDVSDFRQLLRLGRAPWPLRRLAFWGTLYWSGPKRAKRFGTFGVSSLGGLGVEQVYSPHCLTTYLTFGPVSADGDVTVRVVYDHRVMDGRELAEAVVDLERIVETRMAGEMAAGPSRPGRAA
jgi:hypothetical protein